MYLITTTSKKHEANTGGISRELDKYTIVDLNFPLWIADRTNRQKSVKIEVLTT